MRNLLLFPLFLLITVSVPCLTHAQTGWKWGNANVITSCGFEALATAIDKSGSTFEAGYVYGGYGTSYFGTFAIPISGGGEMIITKIDSSGNYVWALAAQNTSAFPGDMITDAAGNAYLYGYYYNTTLIIGTDTLFNPSYDVMYFLIKFAPSGNILWEKNITGYSGNYHPVGNIGIDAAGSIYLSGGFINPSVTIGTSTLINYTPGADSDDVFIAKYDSLGNPIWAKSFGGNNSDWPTTMAISNKGDIYLTGQTNSDSIFIAGNTLTGSRNYICKYDSSGTCIWAKNLDNHTFINRMTINPAQNLYMAGYIDSNVILGTDTLIYAGGSLVIGGGDVFIAKYNSVGNVVWARSAGGDSTDIGWYISLDSCNNIWLSGSMGQFDVPPGYTINFGSHVLAEPVGAPEPMFVAEYNDAGDYLGALALPIGGDDWNGVLPDNKGNFYVVGDYYGTSPVFGPDTIAYTVEELFFEAKYTYSPGGCGYETLSTAKETVPTVAVSIYPNPATNECTIRCSKPFPIGTEAMIYDVTGRLMNTYSLFGSNPVISVASFTPGVYNCRITIPGNTSVAKQLVILK